MAALPHLLPEVAAMVRLQRLTAMRPGEVCRLRPCDLDTSAPVWTYRPRRHKTAHRGRDRVVHLGPIAQAVLAPWLAQPGLRPEDYIFSPRRAKVALWAWQRAARKSKVPAEPAGPPGRGVAEAPGRDVHPDELRPRGPQGVRPGRGAPVVVQPAAAHGRDGDPPAVRLEEAGAVLGHSKMSATEVYAERDLGLAVKVAAEVG